MKVLLWLLPLLVVGARPLILDVSPGTASIALALQRAATEDGPVHVRLQPGVFLVDSPLVIDSTLRHLTISAADRRGDMPVVSGGTPVSSFKKGDRGSAWVAAVPHDLAPPEQLFVSVSGSAAASERRPRARHPNLFEASHIVDSPWLHWAAPLCHAVPHQNKPCNQWARFGFVWNSTDDPVLQKINGTEQGVQAVVYHGWTASRHHVRAALYHNRSLLFENPAQSYIGRFGLDNTGEGGRRFYLSNHVAFLDSPGEWWFDGDLHELHYIPRPEEVPSLEEGNFTAFVPHTGTILNIFDTDDVLIDGVQFSHTDWTCGLREVCDRQSTEWMDSAAIRVWNSSEVHIQHSVLSHHGGFPLWWDRACTNVSLAHSLVEDLAAGGVRVGHSSRERPVSDADKARYAVRGAVIANNTISDGGWDFPSGTAIFSQYRVLGLRVEHNEITRFSYTGVSLGWQWSYAIQDNTGGALVRKNYIHHLGYPRRETGDAMACIYTLNGINGALIDGNVCHDVRAYMNGGYCLSQDQSSSNATFSNNICLRVTGSPHNTHYGTNLRYVNNIFYQGAYLCHYPKLLDWRAAPASIRTSPQKSDCDGAAIGYPGKCPNMLAFERNLILQDHNTSTVVFEGNFVPSSIYGEEYTFTNNTYHSAWQDLGTAAAFGGCSRRSCATPIAHTWTVWKSMGNDVGGAVGDPLFVDPLWETTFNITLSPQSPALAAGFIPFDSSDVGPLKGPRPALREV